MNSEMPFTTDFVEKYIPDLVRVNINSDLIQKPCTLRPDSDFINAILPSVKCYKGNRRQFFYNEDGPDYNVLQNLGLYKVAEGSVTRTVSFNVNRFLRSYLQKHHGYDDSNLPQPNNDNIIRPSLFTQFDLKELRIMAFNRLAEIIVEESNAFVRFMKKAFDKDIPRELTKATLVSIELSWTTENELATFLPRKMQDAWEAYFHIASGSKIDEKGKILYAHRAIGLAYTLYPKAADLIRYEVKISNPYLRRVLPQQLRPFVATHSENMINDLAQRYFQDIINIEGNTSFFSAISPLDFFLAILPAKIEKKSRSLLIELLSKGHVKNHRGIYRQELPRLKKAGMVEYASHGVWRLTPQARDFFEQHGYDHHIA